jgi:hypothetical protein
MTFTALVWMTVAIIRSGSRDSVITSRTRCARCDRRIGLVFGGNQVKHLNGHARSADHQQKHRKANSHPPMPLTHVNSF